jgi:hypothetical protein
MAKRPGRPRKQSEPEGASLREAAAHFGVARKTLLRWLDEGMPSTLYNERRFIDLTAAEEWKAANDATEAETVAQAPQYHPDDIRSKERTLAARIRSTRFGIKCGQLIEADRAEREYTHALTLLNASVNGLASMVFDIITADNAVRILQPVADEVAEGFTLDNPDKWPAPMTLTLDEAEPVLPDNEFEGAALPIFKPVLPLNSGEGKFAAAKVREHEAAMDSLRAVAPYGNFMTKLAADCAGIREIVRKIPAHVAKLIQDDDSQDYIDDLIRYAADAAKKTIIESVLKTPCTWKLERPRRASDFANEPDDVVDGPGNSDIDRLYAAMFPDIVPLGNDAFEDSEFG